MGAWERALAGSRDSVTMGLALAPTAGVLRGYLIFKAMGTARLRALLQTYSAAVDILVNATGSMRSETHVRQCLGQTLWLDIQKLDALLGPDLRRRASSSKTWPQATSVTSALT